MPDAAISRLCALCVIFGVLSTNAQDVNVAGTSSTAQASAACGRALTLHQYAAEALLNCTNAATQRTELCALVGQYEQTTSQAALGMDDQLPLVTFDPSNLSNWEDFLVQTVFAQTADIGEVSYVLSQVNASWSALSASNLTTGPYYSAWLEACSNRADANYHSAEDPQSGFDGVARMNAFLKAANYYFAGFQPFPFSSTAIMAASKAVAAFNMGIALHPGWTVMNFSVPFNNGSADISMPGFLVTPDASKPLPLMLYTGGTDYPKEATFLQYGPGTLERGYAFATFDGPGQGQVIRNPPYMPFYSGWDQVLSAVLDTVTSTFSQYVNSSNIAAAGSSLGGYLNGRACASNSDRLSACVPNPAQTSSGGALHDQGGSPIVYDSRSFSFLNTILGGPFQ